MQGRKTKGNIANYSLVILNAARSPKSLPSTPRPPNMYMTSFTRAAACPSRGLGIKPMHLSSAHVRVLVSKAQVSL